MTELSSESVYFQCNMPSGSMNLQHSTNKNTSLQSTCIWQQFAVNKICLFLTHKVFYMTGWHSFH